MAKIGIMNVGSEGEQLIQRELTRIFPESRILRMVYVKKPDGTYTEIDVLAVEYCGIFVFESKNYSGVILGNDTDTQWTHMRNGTPRPFYSPILQNEGHIRALKFALREYPQIKYYNFVVFSGTAMLRIGSIARPNTHIVMLNNLQSTIRVITEAPQNQRILPTAAMRKEVTDILLQTSRPDMSIRREHLEQIKQMSMKCPKCGRELVERVNRATGEKFYGCKGYPNCKFTKHIE